MFSHGTLVQKISHKDQHILATAHSTMDGDSWGAETAVPFISYGFQRKKLQLLQIHYDSLSSKANSGTILTLDALDFFFPAVQTKPSHYLVQFAYIVVKHLLLWSLKHLSNLFNV